MQAPNPFREFADWRLRTMSDRPRESIRFFRSSLNHSAVWMLVIRGYYDGHPPTVGECQDISLCSRLTTRKMISDAVSLGFFELHSDPEDHRKRTVFPTEQTVREYTVMVRGYLSMCEILRPECPVQKDLGRVLPTSRPEAGGILQGQVPLFGSL